MRIPLLVVSLLVSSAAMAAPSQIHLSWQGPTHTTATVTFRSTDATAQVQYGTESGAFGTTVDAKSQPYQGSYLHVVELTGLSPATTYFYRVGGAGGFSPEYTARTAPTPNAHGSFRFAAWGDSRSNDGPRSQVAAAVRAVEPAFSVTTGDLIESGSDQAQWDEWFTTLQPLATVSPIQTTYGNHEGGHPNYFSQFTMPTHAPANGDEAEAYYSFDYANTHFVSLDSEQMTSAQTQWLEADLAKASQDPNIRWIVAYTHRPPYSSGSHGSDTNVRDTWGPIFEKYGVDVAFFGHDHHYERSKPMAGGNVVTEGGVVYVVTGGAGAPLYAVGSSSFTAFARSVHHFVEMDVTPTQMTLEAKDVSGNTFDSYTFVNNAALPPAPAPDSGGGIGPVAGGDSGSGGPQPTASGGGSNADGVNLPGSAAGGCGGCGSTGASAAALPFALVAGVSFWRSRRRNR